MKLKNNIKGSAYALPFVIDLVNTDRTENNADDCTCTQSKYRVRVPFFQNKENYNCKNNIGNIEKCKNRSAALECGNIEKSKLDYRNQSRSNKSNRSCSQTVESGINILVIPELINEAADDKNDNYRRCNKTDGTKNSSQGTGGHIAKIGAVVYADGTGSGAAYCNCVGNLLIAEPGQTVGYIIQEGDGGKAAAKGEQADLKEFKKYCQVKHYALFLSFTLTIMIPATAAITT